MIDNNSKSKIKIKLKVEALPNIMYSTYLGTLRKKKKKEKNDEYFFSFFFLKKKFTRKQENEKEGIRVHARVNHKTLLVSQGKFRYISYFRINLTSI